MNWLKQLFSRHRRYDELSETIREHLDEKIADLTDRALLGSKLKYRAPRVRQVGSIEERESRSLAVAYVRISVGGYQIRVAPAEQDPRLYDHCPAHTRSWHRGQYRHLHASRCGSAEILAGAQSRATLYRETGAITPRKRAAFLIFSLIT